MKVTSAKIVKRFDNDNSNLKAYCDIVLDDAFCVHGLRILKTLEGKMLVLMPSKKYKDQWKDIAHPINQECRNEIINAVLTAYDKECENPVFPERELE